MGWKWGTRKGGTDLFDESWSEIGLKVSYDSIYMKCPTVLSLKIALYIRNIMIEIVTAVTRAKFDLQPLDCEPNPSSTIFQLRNGSPMAVHGTLMRDRYISMIRVTFEKQGAISLKP